MSVTMAARQNRPANKVSRGRITMRVPYHQKRRPPKFSATAAAMAAIARTRDSRRTCPVGVPCSLDALLPCFMPR